MVKISDKNFKIDSTTNIKTWYLDIYEEDGSVWLTYENKFKPSIQFYDLVNQKLDFEINLIQTGPNGVGTINGFFIKSLDSIYLLNVSDMRLFLINRKGEVQNYFSFLKPLQNFPFGTMSTPTIISGSPAIFYKQKLHLASRPGTGPTDKTTFETGKVDLAIDLTDGHYSLIFNYPEVYKKANFGNFWGKIFRAKTHDNRIIYSFAADENIYVTDYIKSETFFAGSAIFEKPIPYDDVSQMRVNNLKSSMYGGVFYDKYRELYYRIATGGIEEINATFLSREIYDSKPISVIILNNKFEKIGETLLPSKTHDPLGVFVGPEGLYISNSNLENPNLQENLLSFSVYVPQIIN